MNKRILARTIAAIALAFSCMGANAALCLVGTSAPLFGGYSGSTRTSVGNVSVTCTALLVPQDVSYTITFGYGVNAVGTQRRMRFLLGPYMNYNYTCEGNPSQILGDGTGGTCAITGGASDFLGVRVFNHPVNGVIPGGQYVTPGIYTDSVTVNVLY